MKTQDLPIKDIKPNEYNPNEMTDDIYNRLKENYERMGNLQSILVNKTPKGYVIIDGYHRWAVAKELKLKTIPCQILEIEEDEAKMLTLDMNETRGETNPLKKAVLILDLELRIPLDVIKERLHLTEGDIDQYRTLVNLPEVDLDDLKKEIKQKLERLITCPDCGHEFQIQ